MSAEWIVVGYPVCPYCNGQGCPRCGNDGETAVYEWVERDPETAGARQ